MVGVTSNAQSKSIDKLGYMAKYYQSTNNFSRMFKTGNKFTVATRDELIDALRKAKSGDVVYITDNAVINMSGVKYLSVNSGVTLASGRISGLKKGALLYSDSLVNNVFYINGDNVHITGITFRGPDTSRNEAQMQALASQKKFYAVPTSDCIECKFNNLEVDNCELYGWTHAAIYLRLGARNAKIHNNYIHHNQRQGLGYGIALDSATAVIYNNVFEWNNHSVTGTGRKGTSFVAYQNIVLNSLPDSPVFDMHGGKDRKDGTDIAGDSVVLYSNVIYSTSKIFGVRGTPVYRYKIYNNTFINGKVNYQSVRSLNEHRFIDTYGNKAIKN